MSIFRRDNGGSGAGASRGCGAIFGAPITLIFAGICAALFVLNNVLGSPAGDGSFPEAAQATFTFSPGQGHFFPGLITHMFSHANFQHIIGNMIMLLMLGPAVEIAYGKLRYTALYFIAGLAAAFAQAAVSPDVTMLGASGAIAGVMAAFARHWPHEQLYLTRFPMPAWLYMIVWVGSNVLGAQAGEGAGVAFMAHLGGFFAGLLFAFVLGPKGNALTRA